MASDIPAPATPPRWLPPTARPPGARWAPRLSRVVLLVPPALAFLVGSELVWGLLVATLVGGGAAAASALAWGGEAVLTVAALIWLGRVAAREGWWPAAPLAVVAAALLSAPVEDLTWRLLLGADPWWATGRGPLDLLVRAGVRGALAAGLGLVGLWLDRAVLAVPARRPLLAAYWAAGLVGVAWAGTVLALREPGPDTFAPAAEDVEAVRRVMDQVVTLQRRWIASRGFPGEDVSPYLGDPDRVEVEVWRLAGDGWAARVGREGLRPWGCVHWDTRLRANDPALVIPTTPRGRVGPKRVTTCDATAPPSAGGGPLPERARVR